MRRITCDNHNGYVMTFDSTQFSPFILARVDGLYNTSNNVIITNNTMIDGGTYQSSIAKTRNIVLTLLDQPKNFYNVNNRMILYTLFAKGEKGTLTYEENDIVRVIDYYVENVERETKGTCPITVSLLCPDPFFYDIDYQSVQMANWEEDFEFEHDFIASGEELGHRVAVMSQDIINDFAAEDIGLEILLIAKGSVVNPKVTRVESNESIAIGSSENQFVLNSGEYIVITTGIGNKHVYLVSNGVMTEINGYLTEDSVFIQLQRGHNNIGYSADSGVANLEITVRYRYKYEGA